GDRGERQAGRAGADIGRERHLANIEFEPAAHAAHHRDDLVDLHELQVERPEIGASPFDRLGQPVIPERKRQRLHRTAPHYYGGTIAILLVAVTQECSPPQASSGTSQQSSVRGPTWGTK